MRRLLARGSAVRRIEDWSEADSCFDAAVYPSLIVTRREPPTADPVVVRVRRRALAIEWRSPAGAHRLDADPGSPWLLLPPEVRTAFDLLLAHGTPLGASGLGRPTLGVKCGCNDAFTVMRAEDDADDADASVSVAHLGRRGRVEGSVLRPVVRGESLTAWSIRPSPGAIVWTHGPEGAPLAALPRGAARWLAPWRRRLASRTDLHGAQPWWSLFRTEAADPARPRVVWGDFGQRPRAAFVPAEARVVPLNSCYVLACADVADALAITALLNGPLAAAWLNAVAEPARGGWRRYLAWTVSLLPLPAPWARARAILAPLAERALLGIPPSDAELLHGATQAFRLRPDDVAPLVAWCG